MTCDRCTRAPVGECVGEAEINNMLWEMSEQRINELATDPETARSYLVEKSVDLIWRLYFPNFSA